MKKYVLLFALAALIFVLKPTRYAPGILVPAEPLQIALTDEAPVFEKAGWSVHPLATYDITARLLHKKRYYSDAVAGLAPYDFAVGWDCMSDQSVLDELTISQGNRFYFWECAARTPPRPVRELSLHAANMHLIPASFRVRMQLWRASAGDLLRVRGWLVEAAQPGQPAWRSSLTRSDSGNGACEIMWVESCERLTPTEVTSRTLLSPQGSLSAR